MKDICNDCEYLVCPTCGEKHFWFHAMKRGIDCMGGVNLIIDCSNCRNRWVINKPDIEQVRHEEIEKVRDEVVE